MGSRPPRPAASARRAQSAVGRRTQQERTSQAEQALLDAAASLFALRGVDRTSLADVGAQAGYSRGLVNHHFGTKATMVERLARRTQTAFGATVGEFHGNEVDVLVAVAHAYLDTVASDAEPTRAYFVMWGAAFPAEAALRRVFADEDAQLRSSLEGLLRAGLASGNVTQDLDPAVGAVILAGMLRGIGAQYLVDPTAFDMAEARQICEQFVRRSCSPPARTA